MKKNKIHQFVILAGFILWNACASTGTPSGGPKDITPPTLMKSVPLQNQLNYNKKKIEIFFNELVSLENPSEKVIVSPPQKIAPTAKAFGNKISVLLADTLLPETTYTIDFTDAIVDYNEKNKFGDYAFSFSTGETVDSLCISGTVLDASNLNPVPGVIIGVHTNLNDTSFNRVPFERISKTSQRGFFTVKGLPEKKFHIFALGDKNRDYHFDQSGESIAFYDSVITPWIEPCQKTDTIWKDSITVDTIMIRNATCYKPDNIILRYFAEDFGRQYLSKRERPSREKIMLTFGYKSDTLPSLKLLNSKISDWYLLENNPTNDTLTYWITDTIVLSMDTLRLQLDYLKTDSLNNLVSKTDTLKLISRSKGVQNLGSVNKKKKNKEENDNPPPVQHLTLKCTLQDITEINAKPCIQWETPVIRVEGTPWNLYKKKDTTWVKTPCSVLKDSVSLRNYYLVVKWEFGAEYRFDLDSGMVVGLFDKTNDKFSKTFKIRKEEDYSRLIVTVEGIEGSGYVELLDKTDKVLRREKIENRVTDFKYLMPGSYYLRAVEDLNNNFSWDTGNYAEKRQPENVWYNPRILTLRANWDVEESWNVHEYPLLQQKPLELKPKENKK